MNQKILPRVFFCLIVIFVKAWTWAGTHEVGNGGHVLKCESDEVIEFYDLFYYKQVWNKDFDFYLVSDELYENIEFYLNQFKKYFPVESKELIKNLDALKDNLKFLDGIDILPTQDIGAYIIPSGCVLEQLAVQIYDPFSDSVIIHVNKTLFNKINLKNKIIFILHELIFKTFKYADAVNVRILGYWILSESYLFDKDKEKVKLAKKLGFSSIEFAGVSLDLSKEFYFYPDGKIWFASSWINGEFFFEDYTFRNQGFGVYYHANGRLRSVNVLVTLEKQIIVRGKKLNNGLNTLTFDEDGDFLEVK